MKIRVKNEQASNGDKSHQKRDYKYIPNGTYRAILTKVVEQARDKAASDKINKRPYYGLRLGFDFVSPKNKEFTRPTCLLFFELDEHGPFIRNGSVLFTWLNRLTGLKDFPDLNCEDLVRKKYECLIKVETTEINGKTYTNVVDLFSIPVDDKKSSTTHAQIPGHGTKVPDIILKDEFKPSVLNSSPANSSDKESDIFATAGVSESSAEDF